MRYGTGPFVAITRVTGAPHSVSYIRPVSVQYRVIKQLLNEAGCVADFLTLAIMSYKRRPMRHLEEGRQELQIQHRRRHSSNQK